MLLTGKQKSQLSFSGKETILHSYKSYHTSFSANQQRNDLAKKAKNELQNIKFSTDRQ